jgi:soluble lytic murein transglycosylase
MSWPVARGLVFFMAWAALAAADALPSAAQTPSPQKPLSTGLSKEQRAVYIRAFSALDVGKWDDAKQAIRDGRDPLGNKVFRWLQLQLPRSGASFEDIVGFIDANPDWPNLDLLSRRAEEALVDRTDDSVVLAWFALREPLTADGAMRYIEALQRAGEQDKALQLIRSTWAYASFGAAQEAQFLKRYRKQVGNDDHLKRLDRLLWDGRKEEARRMLPRVDGDHKALAEARLRFATMAGGVDAALRKVPEHLAGDPGLAFERMRWRRKKNQHEGAFELLRGAPSDLGRPEIWWNERAILARRAISSGRMAEAYTIVHDHRQTNGAGITEAEFLAGWIALRFRNEPAKALDHFKKLYDVARFPVTQARGAYWAGRAADAAGDKDAARDWYHRAAAFATTYYGQVAASTLSPTNRPEFPAAVLPTDTERTEFERSELTRSAILLQDTDQPARVKAFITRLVNTARTPGQHALAGELATRLERPDLAVSAAKRSVQVAGVVIHDHGWPMIPLSGGDTPERALVFATIRQESAFEADAISRAGARGLMQIIPPTARAVARKLDLPTDHIEHRLLNDTSFNLRLGRSYLASLIDDYDGSYVLALAAYNAGPGRVKQWIRDNGDPRDTKVDVVDWVELIPIEETRNYIQRVLENLQVYRQRLGGQQVAWMIDRDLRRGAITANGGNGGTRK